MEMNKTRKFTVQIISAALAFALAVVFCTVNVSAKSEEMKLIKSKNIKYYSTGLVKQLRSYEGTVYFKYTKSGRMKEIRKGKITYRLKYTNGRLNQVVMTKKGSSIRKIYSVKTEKHNYITRLKKDGRSFKYKYDSKGRLKSFRLGYSGGYFYKNKYKRSSSGYLTKLILSLEDGSDYPYKFTTRIKSGKPSAITQENRNFDHVKETVKYKYKNKSIRKKYRKKVEAQQLDLLYLNVDPCAGYDMGSLYGALWGEDD